MAEETIVVKCTSPWWFRGTLYPAGGTVKVPPGTPVPQGFFVNGVEVPRKEKIKYSEVLEIQSLQQENLDLRQEILRLKNQLSDLTGKKEHKVGTAPVSRAKAGEKE